MLPMIDRRLALLYGLSGAAAALGIPTASKAQVALGWTPAALTVDEARTLSAACERIIPTSDTPGAIAAGAPQFIDRTLATWSSPADAERLKAGLARLDAEARTRFGVAFAGLPPARQDEVLTAMEAEGRSATGHFFPQLREMTTTAYFTSRVGATVTLRYDPNPGEYRGCVPLSEIGRAWAT